MTDSDSPAPDAPTDGAVSLAPRVPLPKSLSLSGRRWRWRTDRDDAALLLMRRFGLDGLQARILAGRGVGADEAALFLEPRLRTSLAHPNVLQDMERATARILAALDSGESFALLSDSDADGSSSAALLVRFFRALGFTPRVVVPDRARDGYGPSAKGMRLLAGEGVSLVITLDCGSTSVEALTAAREANLDVIVCDHHTMTDAPPPAYAIVNPNRADDDSGLGDLAGVGVAFLLALSVGLSLRERGDALGERVPDMLTLTDLVALGTVCDVRRLRGLNRAFVARGLACMSKRGNAGFRALADALDLKRRADASTLGYRFGPCVNAGARMGESDLAMRLLSTDDAAEAESIAIRLTDMNRERRAVEASILADALAILEARPSPPEVVVMVSGPAWHTGVLGIVAARLRERYHLPAVVLSDLGDGRLQGSGRSVDGVDLGGAILAARAAGILLTGGGHPGAAGLSLEVSQLAELESFLRSRLESGAAAAGTESRALDLDESLDAGAVGTDLVNRLATLAPYGVGNPEPRFLFRDLRVVSYKRFSSGVGVSCMFANTSGSRLRGVCFRAYDTELGDALSRVDSAALSVVGSLEMDLYTHKPGLVVQDAARWS